MRFGPEGPSSPVLWINVVGNILYILFNHAFSVTQRFPFELKDYRSMELEWNGTGKDVVWSGSGLIYGKKHGICLEGLMKTTKIFSQDSRSWDRDLKPEPPEYEAGLLTIRFTIILLLVSLSLSSSATWRKTLHYLPMHEMPFACISSLLHLEIET
jgi:hypothetical protein